MKLYSYEFSILFYTTQSIVSSALFIIFFSELFRLLKGMRCETKRREEYTERFNHKKIKIFHD